MQVDHQIVAESWQKFYTTLVNTGVTAPTFAKFYMTYSAVNACIIYMAIFQSISERQSQN